MTVCMFDVFSFALKDGRWLLGKQKKKGGVRFAPVDTTHWIRKDCYAQFAAEKPKPPTEASHNEKQPSRDEGKALEERRNKADGKETGERKRASDSPSSAAVTLTASSS